ncbi:unnamed protein product [Amaranthus hypochondriacus]
MAYPSLRRDLRDWRAVCKVKPKKYQVSVATTNEVDDSAFQEEQRIHFQVSYEDNVDTSLRNPSGQFIECENEPESPTPILDEDADVDLILSGDEQNDDEAEYFSDEGDLDVNYY